MTMAFYEQLGVAPEATLQQLRAAYSETLAQLEERRQRNVDRGLDGADLRAFQRRVEQAWHTLSHVGRRRRYDALLAYERALKSGELQLTQEDDLWDFVSGALVPPAVSAAVTLISRSSALSVGELPVSPGRPKATGLAQVLSSDAASLNAQPERVTSATHIPHTEHSSQSVERPVPAPRAASLSDLVQRYGYGGMLLREARLQKGLGLQQLSHSTKISIRYLEALESETFDVLPSATFVGGYLREIARELGLNADQVARSYLRRMAD